jgi:UDP-N-acetylmuramoylalanine-D-glutamate ligase
MQRVLEADGILFINDSKATTIAANARCARRHRTGLWC